MVSVISYIILLLLFFTGLVNKGIYFGYKETILAMVILYGGSVHTSFIFCLSIQIIYKIKKLKNGFLFWGLCIFNLLELSVLLFLLFSYEEITNIFLFVASILIIGTLKLISIRIYYLLYPKDKKIDSIQYWGDLWKSLFISIIFTCIILFLTINILIRTL